MCGRFTLTTVPELEKVPDGHQMEMILKPRYNVAPMQFCAVIPQSEPGQIHAYRWGLVPSWAKDEKLASRLINARSETIFEKASFKKSVHSQRCLVLADGFYEWKSSGSGKTPYRICLREEETFYFGAIYDLWLDDQGKGLYTFSIITTEPNALMADIHNRMPVIVERGAADHWLEPGLDRREIQSFFVPFDDKKMRAYPVSPNVGNVRNDSISLIRPFQPPPTLF